ncbi:hypothetical protein AC579_7420 [Pseudocercospora musae]|uniref:Thioesterase domain-containing protein n=1 Tax=Pseudocercospora musae TaxID=113226 RepID=A0A139IQB1_9PEZI|nr:hypothetical protein AC579_7420 [Pseudocercospora musae]
MGLPYKYTNPHSPRMPFGSAESDPTAANDDMAPADTKATFMRIPWIARKINQPGTVCRVSNSRTPKPDGEDSLWAEILKTPRTIRSTISFYKKPENDDDPVPEVTTVLTIGNGMNGHPDTIHGGITATMLDECMGICQSVNIERAHIAAVKRGKAFGELPPHEVTAFTRELKVTYLLPVRTPGAIMVTTRRVKKEGRKEWLAGELKQCTGNGEDDDGEVVVCATGEALFLEPRPIKSKI